jgi:NAD(P)-dependent dehydrogenase (short-subunit alcohol dehydrogenase family)
MSDRDPLDFTGKVAIVTGGARGVGRGITNAFLGAGADVVICGRTEPDELPEADGRTAVFIATDVRDADQVDALVQATTARFGRLDVLVNNAGGAPPADTATVSPRFTASIIALNLIAPIVCAQRAYAVMKDQPDGGVIINIGSVSGTRANPGAAAYGAAKAGLINVTQTLALEFAPEVRVVCVTVGLIVTEQAHMYYGDEEGIASVGATVPMGRMADITDVGDACLFVASPLARYFTGTQLVLHGGGEWPAYLQAARNTSA